jgi:hypothetical protein
MAEALDTHKFANAGIAPAKLIGPALASAATIAPTHGIHHVTGVVAIVNITLPAPDFVGTIVLIADAIWTWTNAGNIAVAGTTTAAGRAFRFTYDPATAKWYPDKVA